MEYVNSMNPLVKAIIVGGIVYAVLLKMKPEMFFEADGMPKMGLMNPMVAAGAAAAVYYFAMGMEGAARVSIADGVVKDLNSLLPPETYY